MGKMKDLSIELEEAGLDPFDNSNLQGYVDDTHHFGEDVLKVVDYNTRDINVAAQFINNPPVTINEQYGAYGTEELTKSNPTFRDAMSIELGKCVDGLSDAKLGNELFQKIVDERGGQKAKALVKELNRG